MMNNITSNIINNINLKPIIPPPITNETLYCKSFITNDISDTIILDTGTIIKIIIIADDIEILKFNDNDIILDEEHRIMYNIKKNVFHVNNGSTPAKLTYTIKLKDDMATFYIFYVYPPIINNNYLIKNNSKIIKTFIGNVTLMINKNIKYILMKDAPLKYIIINDEKKVFKQYLKYKNNILCMFINFFITSIKLVFYDNKYSGRIILVLMD